MSEIFPSNDEGSDYLMQKKRKFKDEDQDQMDDQWEQKVGLHDEFNRHKLPHLDIAPNIYHKNGVIGMHHDYLKPLGSHNFPSKNKIKLTINISNPPLHKIKSIPIPQAKLKQPINTPKFSMKSSGIESVLDHILGRKNKKKK